MTTDKRRMIAIMFALTVCVLTLIFALTACDNAQEQETEKWTEEQLSAPKIRALGSVLSWEEVEGADMYYVFDGDKRVAFTREAECDLSAQRLIQCSMFVTVKAVDSKKRHPMSEASNGVAMVVHIPADQWIEDEAATCTAIGHRHKNCKFCGVRVLDEDVETLPHVLKDEWIEETAATCTAQAHHYKKCANCDYRMVEEDYGEMLPHTPGEWIEDSPASCTAKGSRHKDCTVCGQKVEEGEIEMLPHTPSEWIEDSPASCTAKGSHHKDCTVCGQKIEEGEIEMLPHTPSEWIEDSPASCTAKGSRHKDCTICGQKVEEGEIDMLPHEYGAWEEDSEATCTARAHHHRDCQNCEYVDEEDYGDMLPHVLKDEWIEDNYATCVQLAHHHKECTNCGYHMVEEDYGELGYHHPSRRIVERPATCDNPEHWYVECMVCGRRLEEDDDWYHMPPHDYGDWVIDGEYTCGQRAMRHRDCANCGGRDSASFVVPHAFDPITKRCGTCGGSEFTIQDKISFGEYPQTRVKDDGIAATLAQMSGDRPVKGNAGKWTDYGYYTAINTDHNGWWGTPVQEEYMWYIDLEYEGARYRGVYFTLYRASNTTYESSNRLYTSYQDRNGYLVENMYWFKWEPIVWRVLEWTDAEAFLLSTVALDGQQYYHERTGTRTIDGKAVHPNNYKESDIRAWLNGTFFNWAFDDAEQLAIKETEVDNSPASTPTQVATNRPEEDGINVYACENTFDKVFLLSYRELINQSYFSEDFTNGARVRLYPTDYALSQGVPDDDGCHWWTRSPSKYSDNTTWFVSYLGISDSNYEVAQNNVGVVPAIKIQL